jgi:predicted DNA-binding transcriptional regulator YafY
MPRGEIKYLRDPRIVEDGDPATVVARFAGLGQAFHALLSYGPHAEVLAPLELRERIASAAARTAEIYARDMAVTGQPQEAAKPQELVRPA